MNRRCILVGLTLALLAVAAGLLVHRRAREDTRRERARAEMDEIRKAIGIQRSMRTHGIDGSEDPRQRFPFTTVDADACIDTNPDPWGHEYMFESAGHSLTITCLGADGMPDGEGADEDIVLHWPPPTAPAPR